MSVLVGGFIKRVLDDAVLILGQNSGIYSLDQLFMEVESVTSCDVLSDQPDIASLPDFAVDICHVDFGGQLDALEGRQDDREVDFEDGFIDITQVVPRVLDDIEVACLAVHLVLAGEVMFSLHNQVGVFRVGGGVIQLQQFCFYSGPVHAGAIHMPDVSS
jgi:hypothetical protein